MTTAADHIRTLLESSLGAPWKVQFGAWRDAGNASRYAVLRPSGGVAARLVREPQFTVTLMGAEGDGPTVVYEAAVALVERMRYDSAGLVYLEASEPSSSLSGDGRHLSEFAVSAIVN
jgi:hypothetical protein